MMSVARYLTETWPGKVSLILFARRAISFSAGNRTTRVATQILT
jgi:hypothetical protein